MTKLKSILNLGFAFRGQQFFFYKVHANNYYYLNTVLNGLFSKTLLVKTVININIYYFD